MFGVPKLFLLLVLVVFCGSSPPSFIHLVKNCGLLPATSFMLQCKSLVYDILQDKPLSYPSRQSFEGNSGNCEKSQKCLSSFDCEEIRNMENQINSTCEILLYSDKDVNSCLKDLFSSVFITKFSKEKSCLNDAFLDKDMSKRYTVFTNGKYCFDEFVTTHCSSTVSTYFTEGAYKKLTESISTKPIGKECISPQNVLNDIYCKGLVEELNSQLDKKTGNETVGTVFSALCEETVKCSENSCSMHKDWRLRNDLAYICNTPLPSIEE